MILAIIQSRMASERLPGKSMALLAGVPLIEHVVNRVRASNLVNYVCVATTEDASDDVLAAHVTAIGADIYRGDPTNVLGRFYWCAERYPKATVIIRICADDAFVDPKLIDHVLSAFLSEWGNPTDELGPPFFMELGGPTWAYGMGLSVFARVALEMTYTAASSDNDKEHVCDWMQRNFRTWVLKDNQHRATIQTRLTIDTPEDLAFAQGVYEKLYEIDPLFGYDEVLAILPELERAA